MRDRTSVHSPPPLLRKTPTPTPTPRGSAVVDRLLAAGDQYKQHKIELLQQELNSRAFRPEISSASRRMAGALPPLHERALALAKERETRMHLEISRQDGNRVPLGGRRVTSAEAEKKAREFAQWEARRQAKVEETRRKLAAGEAHAGHFQPTLASAVRGKENTSTPTPTPGTSPRAFERRMQADAERRRARLDELKQSADLRELKECRFRAEARPPCAGAPGGARRSTPRVAPKSTPRAPFQQLHLQSMSLEEIFSLVEK